MIAAALGLSALLAASALAFSAVKYAGAAYLIYLGIKMIGTRSVPLTDVPNKINRHNPFIQGIWTEILNPKTAPFFLSFILQFVATSRGHLFVPFFVLGTISVVLNTSADIVVACFAGPLGNKLKNSPRFRTRQRTVSGAGMIGLGIYVAVAESR